MKQEATTLIDENKSLMTAIRLLNNELQTLLKADKVRCFQPNERSDKKEWQVVGAKKKEEKTKTRERNPEKNEKEPQSAPGNNAQTRKPVAVIAGDSIIQNIACAIIQNSACAFRKHGILVKGQTWATLRSTRGILTDFEPLELSLIAHKSDTKHTKKLFWKISLVLLFFCFHLRAANPLGISRKLNLLISEIVVKF